MGVNLTNLVTFLRAWPAATLYKMAVFIFNKGEPLYSKQVQSKRLAELGITKKKASTKAYQAPEGRHSFWCLELLNILTPI